MPEKKNWNKEVPMILFNLLKVVLANHDKLRLQIRKNEDWSKDVPWNKLPN